MVPPAVDNKPSLLVNQEYQRRRQHLAANLISNSLAIIPAAHEIIRNGDSHYRFRQDSDFYYLTGFNEPDAILVIIKDKNTVSVMFNRPSDPLQEQWTGERVGIDGAKDILGVDFAYSIDTFADKLPELLANRSVLYFFPEKHAFYSQQIRGALDFVNAQVRRGICAPQIFYNLAPLLSDMRLSKSPLEIQLMRTATDISVIAHQRAMQTCMQHDWEYQLEAELLFTFINNGASGVAYNPIVGAGKNSCILHYNANNQRLLAGDLVLIDAAAEYSNYAADITRTLPINGYFNARQKAIYELVLIAQQAGIDCIKPGICWDVIQQTIVRILTIGLRDLGLLGGDLSNLIEKNMYKQFYMHNSGHWLGLDVHDCGSYKVHQQWRSLEEGMVLTVEPGIYISQHIAAIDPQWHNIGVRIEDDILVTATGYENLSKNLPRSIADIEAAMHG